MLDKTYRSAEVEARHYAEWDEAGLFDPDVAGGDEAAPWCIMMPPPNVTGGLHIGHALNHTIQDCLTPATIACADGGPCGSRAWIMPASPPR